MLSVVREVEFLWEFGGGVLIITITMYGGGITLLHCVHIEIAVTKTQ